MKFSRRIKKCLIPVILLLLVIGYGAVVTKLEFMGTSYVSTSDIDGNVYISLAYFNGDTSIINLSSDKRTFTLNVNQSGYLNYRIINNMSSFDTVINLTCNSTNETTSFSDFEDIVVDAKSYIDSSLVISKIGTTEELITCTLTNDILERNIKLDNIYVDEGTVYSKLKKLKQNDEIDFKYISSDTNGKGLYELSGTEDNKYPIYYYRGEVDNNNLIYGGFCWNIIRTTETGGIKLIYDGILNNGVCDDTDSSIGTAQWSSVLNDNAYAGYMTGTAGQDTYDKTHTNSFNSNIKNYVENWFKNNLLNYQDGLEDEIYCNDRQIATDEKDNIDSAQWNLSQFTDLGYGENKTFYMAGYRVGPHTINVSPSLSCTNKNDQFTVGSNGNAKLKYPVGLITLDEVSLAGGRGYQKNESVENKSFYLYTGFDYWTMSPGYYGNSMYNLAVRYDGTLNNLRLNSNIGVRPVVTLKENTRIVSGTGTKTDPYVVDPTIKEVVLNVNKTALGKVSLSNLKTEKDQEYLITLTPLEDSYLQSYNCSSGITVSNIDTGKTSTMIQNIKIVNTSNTSGECTFNFKNSLNEWNTTWEYDYKGSEEIFTVPLLAVYRIEAWGASGGNGVLNDKSYNGGYGGYSVGYIELQKDQELFINVGGQGNSSCIQENCAGGYNGGSNSGKYIYDLNNSIGSGGGATHVALKSGLLSTLNNDIDKILIVAGGGGGGESRLNDGWIGGSGGGYIGSSPTVDSYLIEKRVGTGGTQTEGGTSIDANSKGLFGQGGYNEDANCPGSGGGFYGGGFCGGGGSGYIGNSKLTNKTMYCYNCETNSSSSLSTNSTNKYSETPVDSTSKVGNGYIKITLIDIK